MILFHHRLAAVPAACEALALRGVEVVAATEFTELSAWLVCWRGTAVGLIQLPELDSLRATTLAAIRRIDPSVAITPLVPGSTADQLVDQALELLAARHAPAVVDEELSEREAA